MIVGEADRAYERALVFLDRRDLTEREVCVKLAKAGFSDEAVAEAVLSLKDAGLVDDEKYAVRYMEVLAAKGRGRLRIAAEMRQKGLPEELVRYTLEDGRLEDGERARAMEMARRVWAEIPEGMDLRKAMLKVNRRLATLGYSYDVIGEVVSKLKRAERAEKDEDEFGE